MKIAIVIEQYYPEAGGNERSTAQIARRLIDHGHAVTILANLAPREGDLLPGGTVICRGGRKTKSAISLLAFAMWADRKLREGDYDVSLSVTLAVPATVVQPRSGTVRETLWQNIARRPTALKRWLKALSLALNPKQLALLLLEWRTLRHHRVKKVVTISRYVADQLFHHYTIALRRTHAIPNAAEVQPMDALARREIRRKIRQGWQLGEEDLVFLFAAMNPGLKGLGELLDAWKLVIAAHPQARLMVAGMLGHSYFRKAKMLGIDAQVRWVGPTRQIDALYAAADVTVLPTYYDPSSKVVIESLQHGVPAISTRFNGASQWIIDPLRGEANTSPYASAGPVPAEGANAAGRVISSPVAIDELAQAIGEMCDPVQRQRAMQACEKIDPRLSMDQHVAALEKLLVELGRGEDQ